MALLALRRIRAVPVDGRRLLDHAAAAQDHAARRLVAAAQLIGFSEAGDGAVEIAAQIAFEAFVVARDPGEIAERRLALDQAQELIDLDAAASPIDRDLVDTA